MTREGFIWLHGGKIREELMCGNPTWPPYPSLNISLEYRRETDSRTQRGSGKKRY